MSKSGGEKAVAITGGGGEKRAGAKADGHFRGSHGARNSGLSPRLARLHSPFGEGLREHGSTDDQYTSKCKSGGGERR